MREFVQDVLSLIAIATFIATCYAYVGAYIG